MDWNSIARHSQDAFQVAVNEWIARARIQGGTVRGPSAVLTPGSLSSHANIEMRMLHILSSSQVPWDIAAAISRVLSAAWKEWAAGFQIQIPKAYPSLAAVPGAFAPPTHSTGSHPLTHGTSHGEASLKASHLANRLIWALRIHAASAEGETAELPLKNLATWVERSFDDWRAGVKLVGLQGRGPVPTFAPPYVPVGPVVSGDNISTGSLFAGPRFGKIIF